MDDFDKLPPKVKERKRWYPRRGPPEEKLAYTTEQRRRRMIEDRRYRDVVRPQYLLGLARRQGRLKRPDAEIPGELPKHKLWSLKPDEFPLCEVHLPETACAPNIAQQVHHKRGRGKESRHTGALLLNETETFLGICPSCHTWLESNREEAKARGLLESCSPISDS